MDIVKLKNVLKWSGICLVICFILFSVGAIRIAVYNVKLAIDTVKTTMMLTGGIIFVVDLSAIIMYAVLHQSKRNEIIKTKEYVRDIPKEIPVGVAALLIDFYIDNEKDYTATIASLIEKGDIELKDDGKVKINNVYRTNLLDYERVVVDALAVGMDYKLVEERFKKAVREEALKLGVIEKTKKNYKYLIPIVVLILIIIVSNILDNTFGGTLFFFIKLIGLVLACITYIIMILFYKAEPTAEKYQYKRTLKGTKYAEELSGLKNFIHDYTLLKEKGLADTILYDDYIAYAIALGEAKAIEELIINNEKFRNLIYQKNN